jgi:PIN domain nuclease of toxin-antitoxin system
LPSDPSNSLLFSALAVEDLPRLHRDPFDRMLLAQSRVEGPTLLTADAAVLRYPGLVQKV